MAPCPATDGGDAAGRPAGPADARPLVGGPARPLARPAAGRRRPDRGGRGAGLPAVRPLAARPGRRRRAGPAVPGPDRAPWRAARAGARAGDVPAAAVLDHRHRARRLVAGRPARGRVPGPDRSAAAGGAPAARLAALGGLPLGRAGGGPGPAALRRLPVGPAGVRRDRQPVHAVRRAGRRAAGDLRDRGLLAALLAAAVVALRRRAVAVRRRGARRGARRARAAAWPLPTGAGEGATVTVALVQGGVPGAGMDFLGEREQVLRNHVDATHELADDVRAGRVAAPDLVIWPENASDIDPFTDPSARRPDRRRRPRRRRAGARRRRGRRPGPGPRAATPGSSGTRRPARASATSSGTRCRSASTSRSGTSSAAGSSASTRSRATSTPATGRATSTSGRPRVGDVICFEIAYDGLVRDVVTGGADVLVVQTNNATYNGTGQPQQQMAMSRLRAVEHGRTVLVAATSGISAVVAPDGQVVAQAPERVARTLVATVALHDGRTVADQGRRRPGVAARRPRAWRAVAALALALRSPAPGRRGEGSGPAVTSGRRPGPARDGCWSSSRPTTSGTTSSASSARVRAAVPHAPTCWSSTTSSPDGTGELADGLAAADAQVHVLHRVGQAGSRRGLPGRLRVGPAARLRRAGRDGRRRLAPARAAARPAGCPRRRRPGAGLPVGARWVGRQLAARPASCSPAAATPTSGWRSGFGLRDATGGFRAFRRETLDKLDLDDVASQGYCFQVDLAWRAVPQGLRVVEVPIEFVEREHGVSQDERRDRARGALAGHRLGLARPLRGHSRSPAAAGRTLTMGVAAGRAVPGRPDRRDLRHRPGRARRSAPGRPSLLLLLESALGAWLVKREGGRAWDGPADRGRPTGRLPSRELADAGLVLVGGTLLLTPGLRHRRVRASS